MAHNLLTDDIVTLESMDIFENALVATQHTTRKFDKHFGPNGGSNRGNSIRIRKPNFFDVRTGWQADWQDLDEDYVNLTFADPIGVDVKLTEEEMLMDLSSSSEQILKPLMSRLATAVDSMVITELMKSPNFVGTPGTNPSALSTYLSGQAILSDYCCPDDNGGILCAISPQMDVDAVDFLKGLYADVGSLGKQYKDGRMKRAGGLDWARTQQTKTHVTGAVTGAGLVKGANQVGSAIITDDWTASSAIFKQNDIVAFPGCYAVNPVTKESTGRLKTFRVVADYASDGSGEATITISPAIVLTGPKRNVSAAPDDDGAIQLFGHISSYLSKTARQGLMWHKAAIALAFKELGNPEGQGAKGATKSDERLGLSMRYTRAWDIESSMWKIRFDIWPAVAMLRDEWTLRVQSGS
jgi:hypothetical protein